MHLGRWYEISGFFKPNHKYADKILLGLRGNIFLSSEVGKKILNNRVFEKMYFVTSANDFYKNMCMSLFMFSLSGGVSGALSPLNNFF